METGRVERCTDRRFHVGPGQVAALLTHLVPVAVELHHADLVIAGIEQLAVSGLCDKVKAIGGLRPTPFNSQRCCPEVAQRYGWDSGQERGSDLFRLCGWDVTPFLPSKRLD